MDITYQVSAETCQVGAHFKALNEAVLMPLSQILEKFFPFQVSQSPWGGAVPEEGEIGLRRSSLISSYGGSVALIRHGSSFLCLARTYLELLYTFAKVTKMMGFIT